jgi:hypothetical protein
MTICGVGERKTGNDRSRSLRDDNQNANALANATTAMAQLELDGGGVYGGLGVFEVQALHQVDDDLGDGDVAVPLVVAGDDEPRGVLAAGGGEDVVVGVHVAGPELAFVDVGVGQLPVFFLIVDAGLEAAGLLVPGDVEVELEDEDVVVGEETFEFVDVFEAAVRDVAGDELVDAGGEDVFVVGSVEDADDAARRDLGVYAPEEVVAGLERSGDFEGGDSAALRVDTGEDVADGTVFACGVHALENDEKSLGLAGVEDILKVGEPSAVFSEEWFDSLVGFEAAGIGGRYFGEPNFGVRLDEIGRLNFHEAAVVESRLR